MRLPIFLIWLPGCLLLAGCEHHSATQPATTSPAPPATRPADAHPAAPPPEGAVQGDFDGDGTLEYVWLVPPRLTADEQDCVGECVATLASSNPAFRPYRLRQAIGGTLTRYSHLGADQRDYLGILPDWFTSCWRGFYVLTYRPGGWQPGVPAITTHCNQWEANVVPIVRDSTHAGYVLVRYSESTEDSIVTRTKSVPLR